MMVIWKEVVTFNLVLKIDNLASGVSQSLPLALCSYSLTTPLFMLPLPIGLGVA